MKSKFAQNQWTEASKEKDMITVGSLTSDTPKEIAVNRVFIREALMKFMNSLI